MDFFNQTIAQVRELFASMTPGARVTAALLLGVVVVSLAFLFQQSTSGPDQYLFGEPQSQSQIARMSAAVAQAGIEHDVEGNFIRVASGQKLAAMAAIADAGELPADVDRIMSDALDKGSVFDSREVKTQRIKAARERRLSKIIGLMPWVDQAYVIFDEQDARGLRSVRQASAAVSVMPSVGEMLNSQRSRNLKSLVAKSFNLDPMDVTITNLGGGASRSDGLSPDDFDHPYYVTKAKIEERIRNNLTRLLSYIPGVGVEVNAILDEIEGRRELEIKPDQTPATLSSRLIEDTTKQTASGGGGRPGVEANGPLASADTSSSGQEGSSSVLTDETKQNVVGSSQIEKVYSGHALKEAWASVRVPRSYVAQVYRQRAEIKGEEIPDPIPDEALSQLEISITTEIKELVDHQLPRLSLGEDELKQATVVFYDDLKKEMPAPPSIASDALAMLGAYWNSIAMGGLALFSLVMLRSMVTSVSNAETSGRIGALQLGDTGDAIESAEGTGAATSDEDDENERPKLKLQKADTLKDDLTEMVASDPDAAAAILRNWINNAA